MQKITAFIKGIAAYAKRVAAGYEPAVVRGVVFAVFALVAGLGIPQVTELSDEADTVLEFLAYIAPLIAGVSIRSKVSPVAELAEDE